MDHHIKNDMANQIIGDLASTRFVQVDDDGFDLRRNKVTFPTVTVSTAAPLPGHGTE